jgi:[ribosomal protein S5]-alanine N-acetyltransferase
MEINCKEFKLRSLLLDDAENIARNANNRKIWINLRDAFPFPYTLENAKHYINMSVKQYPQYYFGIEVDGEIVGMIAVIPGSDVYIISGEIGYWLAERYWNKGIMTKAIRAILDYGFNKLGLLRIHTGVFGYNTASMKVLEKNGFKKDGIFKNAVKKDGVITDEHRYSIVREDYIQ